MNKDIVRSIFPSGKYVVIRYDQVSSLGMISILSHVDQFVMFVSIKDAIKPCLFSQFHSAVNFYVGLMGEDVVSIDALETDQVIHTILLADNRFITSPDDFEKCMRRRYNG